MATNNVSFSQFTTDVSKVLTDMQALLATLKTFIASISTTTVLSAADQATANQLDAAATAADQAIAGITFPATQS